MADIHFGTDGWRAIIGEDFTDDNLVRVVDAAARVFKEDAVAAGRPADAPGTLIVGHDCRQDAHAYARLAAEVAAAHGFRTLLTQDYCPTPTLCWSVAQDADAVGGIMLTSSHNPAEYLGVKLRMADGGAAGKEFTDRVEAALPDAATAERGACEEADLMTAYLDALKQRVDVDAIRNANLRVVVDPLYGAGRHYLADLLRDLGVEVCEINNAEDPTFDGLHPEPIPPWVDRFVNPHRIITLLVSHLAEDKGQHGRVVSTITASAMLARQCKRLGLELTSTPVGFKWIYAEMEKGDVMLGGEESGGIGIPTHVMERDGLLMALLLAETMAQRGMSLGQLVDDMFEKVGKLEFERRGLSITEAQMAGFRANIVPGYAPDEVCGKKVVDVDRRDGVKFYLEGDAWVMMRPSGTEPLVRVYAEAETVDEVRALLDAAEAVVRA